MADRVLAHTRKAFGWYAARDDRFNSPIVKGMARVKPSERARKYILDDTELGDLWQAIDAAKVPAPYRRLARMLLLTAQRRDEVARMRWEEVDGDTWVIPAERYKTGIANAVPLSAVAQAQLSERRHRGFVFTTTPGTIWQIQQGQKGTRCEDCRNTVGRRAGADAAMDVA